MPITIVRAWNQSGWSQADHLLNESGLDAAQGDKRTFQAFEYRDEEGDRWIYDCTATLNIPGRNVSRITRADR